MTKQQDIISSHRDSPSIGGSVGKRADRIKQHIPIERLLSQYGYDVSELGSEQQFRCDLHGDGSDNAPSARVYPDTNSWYCFACGRARDVISTVMEKEGVEYSKACRLLEEKYGLEVWREYERSSPLDEEVSIESQADKKELCIRRLERATQSRSISFQDALRLWEAVNLVCAQTDPKPSMWDKIYERVCLAEAKDSI